MATIKDLTTAVLELKKRLAVLEAENARLKEDNNLLYQAAKITMEEFISLRDNTSEMLEAQRAEIEALKAERIIVREDGSVDHEAMALQALDLMSTKFEHIEAEIKSLDQAVTSLDNFRSRHLLDHEAEESKQREFTSYFDKHPGDRANI